MSFPNCNSSSGNSRFPLYFAFPTKSSSDSTLTSKNKPKKEKPRTKIGVGKNQTSSETLSKNAVGTAKSGSKSDTSLNEKVKLEKRLFYPSPTTRSKLYPKEKGQNHKEEEKKSRKDTPRPKLAEWKVLEQDVFAEPPLRDVSKKKNPEVTKAVSEIPFAKREEFKDKTQEVASKVDLKLELGDEIQVEKSDEERRVSFEDKIEFIEVFDSPVMTESNSLSRKLNRVSDRTPTPRHSSSFFKSLEEEEAISETGNGTGGGLNNLETSPVKMVPVPFLKDNPLSKTNASSDCYNLNPKLVGFIDRLVADTLNSAIREASIISPPNSPSTDDQEMTSQMIVSLRLERPVSNNNSSLVLTLDKLEVGQRVGIEARLTKERSYVSLTLDPREKKNGASAEQTVPKKQWLLEPIDEEFQTTLESSSDNLSSAGSVSRSILVENKESVLNVHAEPFYPSLQSETVSERIDNGNITRNETAGTVVVSQSRGTWSSYHLIQRGVSCSPQETVPSENHSSLMNTRSVVELASQILEVVSMRDRDLERIFNP